MKLDMTPVRSNYVAPIFGGDDRTPVDPALKARMRRPMVIGSIIVGVLVIGLGTWASLSPLAQGVTAQGEVRVELHGQTIRHKETGTIKKILVQEGQRVRPGQPLILFDDVETRAMTQVYQNQVDGFQAQAARYAAEATGKPLEFPPELMARISDPQVAGAIRDQQFLYTTRLQLFQSQNSVLAQRRVDLLALSTRLGLETRRMSRAHSIQALASSEIVRIEDSYSPTLHGYGAVHEDAAKVIDPALNRLHAGFVAIRALLRRR